jgi:hypothetical protein
LWRSFPWFDVDAFDAWPPSNDLGRLSGYRITLARICQDRPMDFDGYKLRLRIVVRDLKPFEWVLFGFVIHSGWLLLGIG